MKQSFSVLLFTFSVLVAVSQPRIATNLSGKGWKLWKDNDSSWKLDKLYLPLVSIDSLPTHIPSGGWAMLKSADSKEVEVPGTVEEYLQVKPAPEGDIKGVSWWYRNITIPFGINKKKLLRFESARYRSEVFINEKLVGYDLIGNTPFEVDITPYVRPGTTVQLAVRITDPGGNFDWGDGDVIPWGKVNVAGSHGFGGITGQVRLITCDATYIDDIYVQNTPAITKANAIINIINSLKVPVERTVQLAVTNKKYDGDTAFSTVFKKVTLTPGKNEITVAIDAPNADVWSLDTPRLYNCTVVLLDKTKPTDIESTTFGFRWFSAEGIGSDAHFELNGKRIFLKTAISWGFWPVNGIFPSEADAEKQIRLAKELGLNMLNFHRCIGQPIVLDKADELGLLYYEEPGNYMSGNKDLFARACIKEKLLRMVKRDRNHPSMIIYNMQNEMRDVDSGTFVSQRSDMATAHQIDPSRFITRTSGWAIGKDIVDQAKLHARPFDTTLYMNGWFDYHRAPGPHTWMQSMYRNPTLYYGNTDNTKEIVYNGEEGALSTPPRIEKIKEAIDKAPNTGWDGLNYKAQYEDFKHFFTTKNLDFAFPSIDELTKAMGKISLEHQGRKIENCRINNLNDGYAINGWESEALENFSGIVDCYRNPKADPSVLAFYTQPLYIAIKPRKQVIKTGEKLLVDFFIINEKNINGKYILKINLFAPSGANTFTITYPIIINGGIVYGELLKEGIEMPIGTEAGMYSIKAKVLGKVTDPTMEGHEELLAVDWKSNNINGNGAIWEYSHQVQDFLKNEKGVAAKSFKDSLDKQNWIIVTRSPNGGDLAIVPIEQLLDKSGSKNGLTTTYFVGAKFEKAVATQTDANIDLIVNSGATPHPNVPTTFNYCIRWEGSIMPPLTGSYHFELDVAYGGEGTLMINGQSLNYDKKLKRISGDINLEAGKAVTLLAELKHSRHTGSCRLFWTIPDSTNYGQQIINRVKNDGTTLILIDNAANWMDLISKNSSLVYKGKFAVGTNWLGGVHFVTKHPLFKDLPINQGMNWPYEAVVRKGNERIGLLLEGEELIAGAYHCLPQQLGTSVGTIKCGKGKIIFSTLDIYNNLISKESTAEVAKKLLCNYIEFAEKR